MAQNSGSVNGHHPSNSETQLFLELDGKDVGQQVSSSFTLGCGIELTGSFSLFSSNRCCPSFNL
jgi:hypothetical protein